MCAMLLPNMPKFPLYELSCLIFFLVPLLFMAVLYVKMGIRIQSNGFECSVEGSIHGETKQAQSRKTIIQMLSKFPSFPAITSQHHTHRETVHSRRTCAKAPHRIYRNAPTLRFYFDCICSTTPIQALFRLFYKSHTMEFRQSPLIYIVCQGKRNRWII